MAYRALGFDRFRALELWERKNQVMGPLVSALLASGRGESQA